MQSKNYHSPRYHLKTIQSTEKPVARKPSIAIPLSIENILHNQNPSLPLPFNLFSSQQSALPNKLTKIVNTLNLIRYSSVEKEKVPERGRKESFLSSVEKKCLMISGAGQREKKERKMFSQRKISIQTADLDHNFNKQIKYYSPKKEGQNNPQLHPAICSIKCYTETTSTNSSAKVCNGLLLTDFEVGKRIGTGKYGQVFIAKHKRTGMLYALKRISKHNLSPQIKSQLLYQIKIQMFLDHPNIVKLYAFFSDQQYIFLVMELCTSSHLYNFLQAQQNISEHHTKLIIRQLCQGIDYLHQNSILHRDLKLQNILYHFGMVKICDFGWSAVSQTMRQTFCGTPLYISPELLQNKSYNNKVDIWSIGILCFELIYGKVPFEIKCQNDFYKIVKEEVEFPKQPLISESCKQFLRKCLRKNAQERPQIIELMEEEFLESCERVNCSYLY